MDQNSIFSPSLLWDWYEEIENRYREYCDYVPLAEEHFEVWSVKLASLIIEIGSTLDSFLGAARNCQLFNRYSQSQFSNASELNKALKKGKPKIKDHKRIYDAIYGLNEKSIYVKTLKKSILPFEDWKTQDTLWWWTNYNKTKHHRFTRLKDANLKTALYALGGLFLSIIIHVPNKKYLYDIGVIEYQGDFLIENYHWCLDFLLRAEPIITHQDNVASIVASSPLFSYQYQISKPFLSNPRRVRREIEKWPPISKLWPECETDCIGKLYEKCYRESMIKKQLS